MDYEYVSDQGIVDYQLLTLVACDHFSGYVEEFSTGKVDYVKIRHSDDNSKVIVYVKLHGLFVRFGYYGIDGQSNYTRDIFTPGDLRAFGLEVEYDKI